MATLSTSQVQGGRPAYPTYFGYFEVTFESGDTYATGGVTAPAALLDAVGSLTYRHIPIASEGVVPAGGTSPVQVYWVLSSGKLVAYKDPGLETELENTTDLNGHVARLMLVGW